jgi:hypothetical protein
MTDLRANDKPLLAMTYTNDQWNLNAVTPVIVHAVPTFSRQGQEEIRRQLVILAIQSPEVHSWSEQEKIQVRTWVTELLSKEEFTHLSDEIDESQVRPQV